MVRIALFPRPMNTPLGEFADPNPFLPLHREMDWPFDGTLGRSPGDPGSGAPSIVLSPHVDVVETGTAVRIVAQLPGVRWHDIDLQTDGDILIIAGRRWDGCHRPSRRTSGPIRRSVRLPSAVDLEATEAQFAGGVLTVTMPRKASR